jgi:hypothetical protein
LNELGQGKYVAWPQGLVIDPQTGVIDLSKSETGARYNVGFVNAATHDTSYRQLVLAGITYMDGLYYMDSGDTLLRPYFNASPVMTSVCNSSGENDYPGFIFKGYNAAGGNGDNKCRFDCDMPAGQRANDQQLKVRTISGIIDLKKSFREGVLGSDPRNGTTRQVTIYYRLNDKSNMSLQKTSLVLHYYHTLSDVPDSLVSKALATQSDFLRNQAIGVANHSVTAVTGGSNGSGGNSGGGNDGKSSGSNGSNTSTTGGGNPPPKPSPRPPHIVIINVGH